MVVRQPIEQHPILLDWVAFITKCLDFAHTPFPNVRQNKTRK
jgi:hypothetical protein